MSVYLLRFLTHMGGWFVDIFVEYLFRVIARMIKRRGSGAWPVAIYGGAAAEVYYTYRVDGELYTGVNEKPFISHDSGGNYVSNFAPGREFTVRVKPGYPLVSIVREVDQNNSFIPSGETAAVLKAE